MQCPQGQHRGFALLRALAILTEPKSLPLLHEITPRQMHFDLLEK